MDSWQRTSLFWLEELRLFSKRFVTIPYARVLVSKLFDKELMWDSFELDKTTNQEEAEAISQLLQIDNQVLASFEGKTIKSIVKSGIAKHDDVPFLVIEFTDGSSLYLEAAYGNYTGKSKGEYPRNLLISIEKANKVPSEWRSL